MEGCEEQDTLINYVGLFSHGVESLVGGVRGSEGSS